MAECVSEELVNEYFFNLFNLCNKAVKSEIGDWRQAIK